MSARRVTVKRGARYKRSLAVERTYNGKVYDSKLEMEFAKDLNVGKSAGLIQYHLEQVPFRLPGGVVYRCDFMVVEIDGRIRFVDTKGHETEVFKIKKKMVEDIYPVKIEVVKKGKGRYAR